MHWAQDAGADPISVGLTMLPFTRAEFFEVFAAYNAVTWPAAIAAYPVAFFALFLAWRGSARSGPVAGFILALMWAWVGLVYHGIYFSEINPIAYAFAGAFVVQALLFAIHATRSGGFEFTPRSRWRSIVAATMIAYATLAYPLIGVLSGKRFAELPLFGVAPCPLLIFTFALMILAARVPWWLWIVPLLWSALGGSAAVLLAVPQDWALPVSALAALTVAWADRQGALSSRQ